MNPLTNTKNLSKLIENEIKIGAVGTKKSWHSQYRDSAWVFFGGLPFELTEGDIICIFSQYGEVVNINLLRDKKTGKSRGFGFVCYENQLSTDLAVDNFNGTKILSRVIRVDHAANYKPPKEHEDADEITKFLRESGCQGELHKLNSDKNKEKPKDSRDLTRDVKIENDRDREDNKYSQKRREKNRRSKSSSRFKSRSRSRERERQRDKERDRERYNEKHRERERDRDRDRHHHHHSSKSSRY